MLTEDPEPPAPRYAFIGVRACELAAIDVQDRVFVGPGAQDPVYGPCGGAFLVAVNCAEAGGTCFCVSMDTGPKVTRGTTSRSPSCSRATSTCSSWRSGANAARR